MLFNSITFILFFFWVLVVHYLPLNWSLKKAHLLLASYVFYAAWNPPFVLLLWFSTLVDWQMAKHMDKQVSKRKRKTWLAISLSANLGMLGVFKYADFLMANFNQLLAWLSIDMQFAEPGLILPMGISFFTFQTLSYTLDVYFKRLKPWDSFLDYALFVSFFPQLVAGPIVRAKTFLPQLIKQRTVSVNHFSVGICFFVFGLFQKTVMADVLFAPIVNQVYENHEQLDLLSAWLGGLFFSAQIFCDFSGYSMCAIGLAMCLGLTLPTNFKSPFTAIGFSDFWRRWHISLSSWLRDYLYIPLGGNRMGRLLRYRNLVITMLLGGLWHGAAWTFVIWGALHGLYLVVEQGVKHVFKSTPNLLMKTLLAGMTFVCVMLAFVVFRAENGAQAMNILTGMMTSSGGATVIARNAWLNIVCVAFLLMLLLQWFIRDRKLTNVITQTNGIIRAVILSFCLLLIFISNGDSDAFIYFQF